MCKIIKFFKNGGGELISLSTFLYCVFFFCLLSCNNRDQDKIPVNTEINLDRALSVNHFEISEKSDLLTKREIFRLSGNGEDFDTITNEALRKFRTSELLKIDLLDEKKIRITSYIANSIKNIKIYANVRVLNKEPFLIATLDSLPAFAQIDITPNFVLKQSTYELNKGKYVSFYLPEMRNSSIQFSIDSEDELYKKLKNEIKVDWEVFFGKYNQRNWARINSLYAREWVVMITNLAYMFSTPEMKHIMYNYQKIMDGSITNNRGQKLTPKEHEDLYYRILSNRRLSLGITTIGGGLGGGQVLGVDHWMFYSHYYSLPGVPWEMITHEFGHVLGFTHASNMTYGKHDGWAANAMPQLHNYLRKADRLPYNDPKMIDFTNPVYKERFYPNRSINNRFMRYNNNDTRIDKYFKENPNWIK